MSALAFSLVASAALAQNGFDGSPSAAAAAQRASVSVVCGAETNSLTRTENTGLTFFNTTFQVLPGTLVTVNVPAGASRCVKVLFTAEAGATNFCYVRATANGVPMFPNGGNFQTLVSDDDSANGHSFLWVGRFSAGTYTIAIQRRVDLGSCGVDDWTMDVEIHQ